MHAPVIISLGAGLLIGFLAQRTRFCTMGSIRDIILMRDTHLVSGVAGMVIAAFVMNLIFGAVKLGFTAQPIAHSSHLWNFLGMILAGLAFALAGGCPGRQLFLAGEGDSDSGVFILGMVVGAGVAHNFALAGKPDKIVEGMLNVGGISTAGMIAVITGIIFCCAIGYFMREKI
jgi:YedE family putative selenium metabolism protein